MLRHFFHGVKCPGYRNLNKCQIPSHTGLNSCQIPSHTGLNSCQIPSHTGLNSCQMPRGCPGGGWAFLDLTHTLYGINLNTCQHLEIRNQDTFIIALPLPRTPTPQKRKPDQSFPSNPVGSLATKKLFLFLLTPFDFNLIFLSLFLLFFLFNMPLLCTLLSSLIFKLFFSMLSFSSFFLVFFSSSSYSPSSPLPSISTSSSPFFPSLPREQPPPTFPPPSCSLSSTLPRPPPPQSPYRFHSLHLPYKSS